MTRMLSIMSAFFHVLVRVPRLKRWYENKVKYTFGVVPSLNKLWDQLWQDLKEVGRIRCLGVVFSSKDIVVHVRASYLPYRRTRLFRKFLITLVDMPQSVQSAQRCIESASRYGEERHLEIMPAVDKFHSEAFFRKHGLIWIERYSLQINPLAAMGCFASHYKLWSHCVETGDPIIVLEHDAEFVRSIPELRFRDVAVLASGRGRHNIGRVLPFLGSEVSHEGRHLCGAHAYAITPEGAQKLIAQASRQFLPPADCFVHKRNINIIACEPYPLRAVRGYSSIAFFGSYQCLTLQTAKARKKTV